MYRALEGPKVIRVILVLKGLTVSRVQLVTGEHKAIKVTQVLKDLMEYKVRPVFKVLEVSKDSEELRVIKVIQELRAQAEYKVRQVYRAPLVIVELKVIRVTQVLKDLTEYKVQLATVEPKDT